MKLVLFDVAYLEDQIDLIFSRPYRRIYKDWPIRMPILVIIYKIPQVYEPWFVSFIGYK